MKNLILSPIFAFAVLTSSLAAVRSDVYIDDQGQWHPAAVSNEIARISSTVAAVNIAEARAEIITAAVEQASANLDRAVELLDSRLGWNTIRLQCVGLGLSSTNDPETAECVLTECKAVSNDTTSIFVTLEWKYINCTVASHDILCSSCLTNSVETWASATMTTPEQWATDAYRSTLTLPKATYGSSAFFVVSYEVDRPVDDGKFMNVYVEGEETAVDFYPNAHYRIYYIKDSKNRSNITRWERID